MRLALVAMPWNRFDMPSPAVGMLAAVVREQLPHVPVDCLYEYVDVRSRFGDLRDRYEDIARDDRLGELIYATLLYPEQRTHVADYYATWTARRLELDPSTSEPRAELDEILTATSSHVDDLVERLAGSYDVVGFTTSYCQLFPSLAVARQLKERSPETHVVLGGMGVAYEVGETVLAEYPFVDEVVQGEGEAALVELLERRAEREVRELVTPTDKREPSASLQGFPARSRAAPTSPIDLDALPIPDYDDYAKVARTHRIRWIIPLEGSRGCWWDRVIKTGDRMKTCYFCSLNTTTYRHKSAERLTAEVRHQVERYERLELRFLDNIIRHRGVAELSEGLRSIGKQMTFFYELRAQIDPPDLLALYEAGCDTVQIGIEGLSSDYLKRIGKGTRTIQNLQAMRTCYELGIYSGSNLLIGFPGATQAEVDETERTIRRFATAFQPLDIAEFGLYLNSSVHRRPDAFGITNLRNADDFRAALPAEVYERLHLYWLDYDVIEPAGNWSRVKTAIADWRALHRRLTLDDGTEWFLGTRPLAYRDGGSFLEVVDRRRHLNLYTFREPWRSVLLYCCQIRAIEDVCQRFAGVDVAGDPIEARQIELALHGLEDAGLVFIESGQVLALPVASRPELAKARMQGDVNYAEPISRRRAG